MSGVSTDPAETVAVELLRTAPPMLVLRPGDRVLVAFADDPEQPVIQEITRTLRKAFPGVDFTVLTGVSAIAVQGGDRRAPS